MNIIGLQRLTFCVSDVPAAIRFLLDWNLECLESSDSHGLFRTLEGAEVAVAAIEAESMALVVNADCNLREIVWAVADASAMAAIEKSLRRFCEVKRRNDGAVLTTDPNGFTVSFEVSRLRALVPADPIVNLPGRPVRINQPVEFSARPPVRHMGHVAIFVTDLERATSFYQDGLGFRPSDVYPGKGIFLRAPGSHDHHNIFLLKRDGPVGFHHMSFEVADFQEVVTAGRNMRENGWKTQFGPGRHVLGSNYFWYFHTPMGGASEYYADMDYLDDDWKPRSWTYSPDVVAAWTAQMGEAPATN